MTTFSFYLLMTGQTKSRLEKLVQLVEAQGSIELYQLASLLGLSPSYCYQLVRMAAASGQLIWDKAPGQSEEFRVWSPSAYRQAAKRYLASVLLRQLLSPFCMLCRQEIQGFSAQRERAILDHWRSHDSLFDEDLLAELIAELPQEQAAKFQGALKRSAG